MSRFSFERGILWLFWGRYKHLLSVCDYNKRVTGLLTGMIVQGHAKPPVQTYCESKSSFWESTLPLLVGII